MWYVYVIDINDERSLLPLSARNLDDATKEARSEIVGEYTGDGWWDNGMWHDEEAESAILLDVAKEISLPIAEWYKQAEAQQDEEDMKQLEQRERQEYERLKDKFE